MAVGAWNALLLITRIALTSSPNGQPEPRLLALPGLDHTAKQLRGHLQRACNRSCDLICKPHIFCRNRSDHIDDLLYRHRRIVDVRRRVGQREDDRNWVVGELTLDTLH